MLTCFYFSRSEGSREGGNLARGFLKMIERDGVGLPSTLSSMSRKHNSPGLNFLVSSRPEGVSRPGTAGRTVETDITRIRPIQARPPRSRGAVACDAAASADSCSARPLRVSSRRRRLGRLLRPLLRAQGGLQRRRRGRRAVAEPSTPSTRYIYISYTHRPGGPGRRPTSRYAARESLVRTTSPGDC